LLDVYNSQQRLGLNPDELHFEIKSARIVLRREAGAALQVAEAVAVAGQEPQLCNKW